MKLERWLLAVWYGGMGDGWWLAPLGWLMQVVTALRQSLYRSGWLRSHEVSVPVIVIGNITAGGTGKTPLVIWLANRLARSGLRVGVLTRGYGGKASRDAAEPSVISGKTDPSVAGDEAVLLAHATPATVVVAADRVDGARQLEADGAQVIVCDDGLQHYRLNRVAEIAVIDGQRGFGNGRFIPAGPLRESPKRLQDVTATVVNGQVDPARWPDAITMLVDGRQAVSLSTGQTRSLSEWAGKSVHAVAGIGNPDRFFALLESCHIDIQRHVFPDHAQYTADDLCFDDDLPVLMTEKDAVKCAAFATGQMWSVPVQARFSAADERLLCDRISAASGLDLSDDANDGF